MDCEKIGELIRSQRIKKGLTQKQLGELIFVSDKAVSKWERGAGCPDIELINRLSECLDLKAEDLLNGQTDTQGIQKGTMEKTKFYVCPHCGNLITSLNAAEVTCCSEKLTELVAKPEEGKHSLNVEVLDDEFHITFSHDMTKEHYLNFIAYVSYRDIYVVKLYPEQEGELYMPRLRGGKFYFGCNRHGLWEKTL